MKKQELPELEREPIEQMLFNYYKTQKAINLNLNDRIIRLEKRMNDHENNHEAHTL